MRGEKKGAEARREAGGEREGEKRRWRRREGGSQQLYARIDAAADVARRGAGGQ